MTRGKQQILLTYLPGKTFDFQGIAAIARVDSIRGVPRNDLNTHRVVQKIALEARAWSVPYRPQLRDEVLTQPDRFVLLDPVEVQAVLFPKVFWCENPRCSRVFNQEHVSNPRRRCPSCRSKVNQLRFVQIHRCGDLRPLAPPQCAQCHNTNEMALDTGGSERISRFRWICRRCHRAVRVFVGRCNACQWPTGGQEQNADIAVHRAGNTFYAHSTVLLNVPQSQFDAFFQLPEWPFVAAAKFFDLPEVSDRRLSDLATATAHTQEGDPGLSGPDLDALLERQQRGELTAEQLVREMQSLRTQRNQERDAAAPSRLAGVIQERSGVAASTWEHAGWEMLEAVVPAERGQTTELLDHDGPNDMEHQRVLARSLGIGSLKLISDFPIVTATYGYSRSQYSPDECRLNAFPPEPSHDGRLPIFVDQVQADAILVKIDPHAVWSWLGANGHILHLPPGTDPTLARGAFFVESFENAPLRQTLQNDWPVQRAVFGLLHTLCHISVRQAALLCGLDRTSLSEYVLPRALSFAIYCNHRSGATIGALTALFEQSLGEWLQSVREARRCVYDPVCRDRESSCHVCTHLAETSCRFFNLNLGRAFLFGGPDPYLGHILQGFFDRTLL